MLPWASRDAGHPAPDTALNRTIFIPADRRLFRTGVPLDPTQPLRFTATGRWRDLHLGADAGGIAEPNAFQRLFARFKRIPQARYMALIGCVDGDLATAFVIGTGLAMWASPRAGELCCFANDVPGFYWNNSGWVSLTIGAP
jgi:hypothetical protein